MPQGHLPEAASVPFYQPIQGWCGPLRGHTRDAPVPAVHVPCRMFAQLPVAGGPVAGTPDVAVSRDTVLRAPSWGDFASSQRQRRKGALAGRAWSCRVRCAFTAAAHQHLPPPPRPPPQDPLAGGAARGLRHVRREPGHGAQPRLHQR
jgi:hypothetical protein